jgi:hypothetical protein
MVVQDLERVEWRKGGRLEVDWADATLAGSRGALRFDGDGSAGSVHNPQR